MSLVVAVEKPIPPKTTTEEDITTAGQRRINLIWEVTQAIVTILITVGALYGSLVGIKSDVLNYAFIAIISTYYARTNHTRIGGIGVKYEGR